MRGDGAVIALGQKMVVRKHTEGDGECEWERERECEWNKCEWKCECVGETRRYGKESRRCGQSSRVKAKKGCEERGKKGSATPRLLVLVLEGPPRTNA
ncbi:hypothetical protein GQ53DRAFT_215978 [Thozetella sp. PMI_491]|nr:hypothetical protein GQ53DRAFT_215978 [Thozetella sp. PMI_491]